MRIGLFSNAYRPVVSGVVNSLNEIRRGLLKRNHTPFLFAPEARGYRESHAGVFRFPSLELDRSVEFPVPIPYSAKLARLVPKMGLDLIHSHHPILVGATAAGFARKLRLPLIYTFHTQIEQYTHYVPFFSHETVREAARAKVGRYLAKCELVICPSSTIRDYIDSYGAHTRVVTLPNAIDVKKFLRRDSGGPSLRAHLNLPPETCISLSVGRLAPEKGLPFLFDCFKKTSSATPHHLVVVGSGPQKAELMSLACQMGCENRIHFLGSVPYQQMPHLYQQSDLFVICSTTEVKPLVVIEALASGLPVLAVSACGTKDTVTHEKDGLLSDLDNSNYTGAWNRLLQNRDFRELLSRHASQTAQSYSIEAYIDRLCRLYEEAMTSYQRGALQKETG